MFRIILEWLIEALVSLYDKLYRDDPPPKPKVAWEIRVFPGKQGAVRDKPEPPPYPVAWLLVENELATVGVNPDGSLQEVEKKTQEGVFKFYYIAFGEKKRGWILFKKDRMELISRVVG
jgi:hypothetical protein